MRIQGLDVRAKREHINSMETSVAWKIVQDELEVRKERIAQDILKDDPSDVVSIARKQGEYKALKMLQDITQYLFPDSKEE